MGKLILDQYWTMNQLKPVFLATLRRYSISFRAFVCCHIMFKPAGWRKIEVTKDDF